MEYKGILLPDDMPAQVETFMSVAIDTLTAETRLSPLDHAALFIMAERYATYLEATAALAGTGFSAAGVRDGSAVTRPEVKVQRDAQRDFLDLCKEFGFTLASRGKIKEQPKKEESPLDIFAKEG